MQEYATFSQIAFVRRDLLTSTAGAVLRWGRGAQAPQMLARPPPPNILVPTAKIRIVKI